MDHLSFDRLLDLSLNFILVVYICKLPSLLTGNPKGVVEKKLKF